MSNIQDIISKALALWSEKHAESTVRCQGIYFSALFKAAEEGGFDSPCQKLYDIFLKGAKTPATYFNRAHSAMDNTIHSIWKSKGSFPTSYKQRCPQLHKTGSYTHFHNAERRLNPLLSYLQKQKKSLNTTVKALQNLFLMGSTGCLLLLQVPKNLFHK